MNWNIPALRENGDPLEVSEIGGYELRYKTRNSDTYTSVVINGGEVNSHYFNHLEGELEFQIAAFDVNGLYSRFVPIQPHLNWWGVFIFHDSFFNTVVFDDIIARSIVAKVCIITVLVGWVRIIINFFPTLSSKISSSIFAR